MTDMEFENEALTAPAIPSQELRVSTADYTEAMKLSEEIGKVKMAQSIASGLSLGVIRWFASMKEGKRYRGQTLIDYRGYPFNPQTFEELCEGMGFSRQSIDEQLQNFATLGEQYLEEAQQMGLKVRDLRKIRKALKEASPEQGEELMINLRNARDSNEDLHTAIDVLCAQQTASKEKIKRLEGEIRKLEEDKNNLKEDYKAQSKVLETRNEQYEEVKEVLARATSPAPADREAARMEWMEKARAEVDGVCIKAMHAMLNMATAAEGIYLDDRADAALKLYITDRINVAIQDIGNLLRDKYLEIDIEREFKSPEYMHLNKDQ